VVVCALLMRHMRVATQKINIVAWIGRVGQPQPQTQYRRRALKRDFRRTSSQQQQTPASNFVTPSGCISEIVVLLFAPVQRRDGDQQPAEDKTCFAQ
jgi:hypothetical protein